MIKHLTRHGNSLALIIDRPILDLLNISDETPLDISTDGEVLILSPVKDRKRKEAFQKALLAANQKHGPALKKLAE